MLVQPSRKVAKTGKVPVRPGTSPTGWHPKLGLRVLPNDFVVTATPAVSNWLSWMAIASVKHGSIDQTRLSAQ